MGNHSQSADYKGLTDWVEVFRAGTHKDSLGRTHTIRREQLDELVANLSAAAPPPHVITHNELYSPFRYGDVVAAKRDGDALFVQSANIEPQFERLIADGRLPDRSVRIRNTDTGLALSHIAWLGAEPPAVEGMAPVQFAAAGAQVMDFNYAAVRSSGLLARMQRRMREFLIDKYSVEDADRVMPEYEVEAAEECHLEARAHPEPDLEPAFSRPAPGPQATGDLPMSADAQRLQADFAALEAERTTLKAQLDAERHKTRVAEDQAVITAAIDAGRLTPAQAEGMAEFAAGLDQGDDAQFEFSAGDGKVKKTRRAWFHDFVAKLGKQVELGESDAGKSLASGAADFAAPAGYSVDTTQTDLYRRVAAHRAAHPDLSFEQALGAVHNR